MKKKVLLIQPTHGIWDGIFIRFPESVLSVAAMPHSKGYDVTILDLRVLKNWKNELKKYLQNGSPICVGITALTGPSIKDLIDSVDIIKNFGSEPANFLDLGGTANKDRAIEGFKIIQSDPKVKVILINIFGGIIRCDMIAEGIINAAKEIDLKLPVVVRFQGTNAEKGRNIIKKSSLNIIAADTLDDAAKKAVEASNY